MLKQWVVFAFPVIASPLLIAQTTPQGSRQGGAARPAQTPAEWQRKHDTALKYRSLEDFYNALKKEAASKPKAPLPEWSGIWTADSVDSFGNCLGGSQCYFRPGPGGVAPKLRPVAMGGLKSGEEKSAKCLIYGGNRSTCGP